MFGILNKHRFFSYFAAGVCVVFLLFSFACAKPDALIVFAAASLQDVFTEFQPAAEKASRRNIAYNFGGSGVLRMQIENGAPADVFVSASVHEMDRLRAAFPVEEETLNTPLYNALALIGPPGSPRLPDKATLPSLLNETRRFAMGDPAVVPAGRYAEQAIGKLNLWRSTAGRILHAQNVRQVLTYVETGAVPYGFVFLSDALGSAAQGRSSLIYQFAPEDIDDPVQYQAVVLTSSAQKEKAAAFVQFLESEEARQAFLKAGFGVP
jgi:molybdate transport system substrate-binding protein